MNENDDLKYTGFYRGLVVDNNDPDKQGRIRVRVYPMFAGINIKDDHIPWAVPAMPLFSGAGVGFGAFCIPEEDSYVWVFFEEGDIYQPVYFAEAQTATYGIPESVKTNYPYRRVLRTKNGIEIRIDDSVNTIRVSNQLGYLEIDTIGNVVLSGNSLTFVLLDASKNTSIAADVDGNITVQGTTVNINP